MIPYDFCVFERKSVSLSKKSLPTVLIISKVIALCASFHGSLTAGRTGGAGRNST